MYEQEGGKDIEYAALWQGNKGLPLVNALYFQ